MLSFAKGEMLENSTLRSVKVSDEGVLSVGNKEIEFKFYPLTEKSQMFIKSLQTVVWIMIK